MRTEAISSVPISSTEPQIRLMHRVVTRGWLCSLSLLGVFGCSGAAAPPGHRAAFPEPSGNDEVMRDRVPAQSGRGVVLELSSDPQLTIGEQEPAVHVTITNRTSEVLAAEALAPSLSVDGLPALRLDLASQGLLRIAPGETVEFDQNLGVRLLTPGEHTLTLDLGDSHSPPLRIRVIGD